MSLSIDMDKAKILHIEDGRDGKAIEAFLSKVDSSTIKTISMDMAPAFVGALQAHILLTYLVFGLG